MNDYFFPQVGEAMQLMHDRKNVGKLVLDPQMEPKQKDAKETAESAGSGEEGEKNN